MSVTALDLALQGLAAIDGDLGSAELRIRSAVDLLQAHAGEPEVPDLPNRREAVANAVLALRRIEEAIDRVERAAALVTPPSG